MPLPDLCLLPHEVGDLPLGEPLCAPADERVRVTHTIWGGDYLVRQILIGNGHIEFVARREILEAPLLYLPFLESAELLSVALNKGNFERCLYFDRDYNLVSSCASWHFCLKINSSGHSDWISRDGQKGRFKWMKPPLYYERLSANWRIEATNKQIERDIHSMLNDCESDCAFALRWIQLCKDEQNALLFKVEKGTLESCRNLLRDALWSDTFFNSDSWEWTVDLSDIGAHPIEEVMLGNALNASFIENTNYNYDLSLRQRRLLELVIKDFQLHHNRELGAKYLVQQIWKFDGWEWTFVIPKPSAHEQLEAHLNLRNFLHDKVTPAELAELMDNS